eukprot:scaffold316918_cov21-Tisochrysis_lutea.AAC.1
MVGGSTTSSVPDLSLAGSHGSHFNVIDLTGPEHLAGAEQERSDACATGQPQGGGMSSLPQPPLPRSAPAQQTASALPQPLHPRSTPGQQISSGAAAMGGSGSGSVAPIGEGGSSSGTPGAPQHAQQGGEAPPPPEQQAPQQGPLG